MSDEYYGSVTQTKFTDEVDLHVEEVKIQGFTIIENLLNNEELNDARLLIDKIYIQQEAEFGGNRLSLIGEENLCRFCLKYNDQFLPYIINPRIIQIVKVLLGEYFILNLQNAIINLPKTPHHQSLWHRDLPYQNFVSSEPLSINALYAIDDFSEDSGGTVVLPFSHCLSKFPSELYVNRHQKNVTVKAGSVVVFNSMLFHKAGNNVSGEVRRAINHMYTIPIIKQQYNIASYARNKLIEDPFLKMLFGVTSDVPDDDVAWRKNRMDKLSS